MNTQSNEVELTTEEISKVNLIITGIQDNLNKVIASINRGNLDEAISYLNTGISISNCPLCKRELGILKADITHNKEICLLKSDTCDIEKQAIIEKTETLKEDFIPIKTTKKALIEKKKSLELKSITPKPLNLPKLTMFPFTLNNLFYNKRK